MLDVKLEINGKEVDKIAINNIGGDRDLVHYVIAVGGVENMSSVMDFPRRHGVLELLRQALNAVAEKNGGTIPSLAKL